MATTYTENGGGAPDGSDLNFTYSFETIETTDSSKTDGTANLEVKVALNGATQATSKYRVISSPAAIEFNNTSIDSTVQETSGAPKTGVKVRVYRDTKVSSPGDKRHVFQAGSAIKANALNDIYEHALFALDEEREQNIFSEDIEDGAVTRSKIFADAVDGTKIADDSLDSEHYVDGSVDLAHLSANSVNSSKIVDGSIVNADINASAGIEISKLGDVASAKILVGNGSNRPTAVDMSGDVTIDNAGATTIGADAVQIGNISDTETTLTANSDAKIPTSKAVADHVVDVVNSVGGFVIVPDKDNFPASHPDPNNDSGTVLSITNPNGLTVSSNTSSNGTRTGGSSTVTINNIPTDAGSTLTANYTMLVQTTSTEHTYDFYKFLAKDGDVLSLSNDINDFAARYRVNAGEPSSDNDEGDLVYDTNANKMKVYDGSEWGEVTSTGDFKYIALTAAGTSNAPTYGSATSFDLKEGSISGAAASVTSAAQLIVSVNGVIQKPNSGTSAPTEGFALSDSDTIIFSSAPPADSDIFAIQIGAATDLQVPADNTVTAAKLDLSIVQGDLIYGTGTDTWAKLAKGTAGQVLKMNSGATAPEWADDLNTQIGGANGVDFNDDVKVRFGAGPDMEIYGHSNNSGHIRNANGGIGITALASPYQVSLNAYNTTTASTQTCVSANSGSSTNAEFYIGGVLAFQTAAITGGEDSVGINAKGGNFTGDVHFVGADGLVWWDKSDNKLTFNNNTKALFGTDEDLRIWHDGSNSYIDEQGTGDLLLTATAGNIQLKKNTGEKMLQANVDGGVELYYDNTKEFETIDGGVSLHGYSASASQGYTNSSGSTIINFDLANHFTFTLSGAITFANPSTESTGQSGTITITQPSSGSTYTAAWGDQYKWAGGTAPNLTQTNDAVDRIDYVVVNPGNIHCVASLDMKAS